MGAKNPADRREKLFDLSVARTASVAMVSPQVRDRFVEGRRVPARKATVVMNGIPIQRYVAASPDSRQQARTTLGLAPDALVVGTVGRLVGVKNHALLLAAAAALRPDFASLRVVLIGDGDLRAALQHQAKLAGIDDVVSFAGERPDVPTVLSAFDIFAMPSLSEGHSIALLEAACTGLPTVATRVGGNPEIVQEGQTGLLVPSQDVAALQAALDTLLRDADLRQRMGNHARQWAQQTVSLAAMANHYDAVYTSVLGRSSDQAAVPAR